MDAALRKKLVTTRSVAKASLTRLLTFVNEFKVTGISDTLDITVRLEQLPKIVEKYEDAQSQLELCENVDMHAEDRETFENMFFEVSRKMRAIQINHENASDKVPSDAGSASSASKRSIKLPTIKLPLFNGDVTQFRHFYDTFVSLVVSNDELEDIVKYHHLLSALTGEAHNVIAHLPVTNNNFKVAFDLVCARYNNPRLIASAHLKRLLALPLMKNACANELRALLNEASSNVHALMALHLDVSLEDIIISQLLIDKVEPSIRAELEATLNSNSFPTFKETCAFLDNKCKSLEILKAAIPPRHCMPSSQHQKASNTKQSEYSRQIYVVTSTACVMCNQPHALHKCSKFREAAYSERKAIVTRNNLCYNCLKSDHKAFNCESGRCRTCGKRHHTLLHEEVQRAQDERRDMCPSNMQQESNETHQSSMPTSSYCSLKVSPGKRVLLATARIQLRDSSGNLQTCRALLDSGSQSCFISEACAQRLRLQRWHSRVPIQGIGATHAETKHRVSVQVCSFTSQVMFAVDCLVLPKITDNLPEQIIDPSTWNMPNVQLADPEFWLPGKVDVLIGAELCPYILKSSVISRGADYPVLQETALGWVVSGQYTPVDHTSSSRRPVVSCFAKTDTDVQTLLKKFWEIEELNRVTMTKEEKQCEAHFVEHTTKDSTGRFVVRLPFRQESSQLGDSFHTAAKRFYQTEQKLSRQPKLKQSYTEFMREYEDLGHMEPVVSPAAVSYYMPHHAVLKEASSTTKTRVVFDCSAKTSTNLSLNSLLMVGPTIQQDLCSIILRFRIHRIAFTADIEKMYRQVLVADEDRVYQRILWRSDKSAPLREYQLKTVTYGMACAPFLAVRCLLQLAHEESERSKAADILANDFYVDDCISGCDTVEAAIKVQQDLTKLLKKGGFSLRKWCSNSAELLENVHSDLRETQLPLRLDNDDDVKTLGLLWHPAADQFQIVHSVQQASKAYSITKRIVLSVTSSIFDPLGLISPIVITFKIFLQRLWQHQLTWDEPLPANLNCMWQTLCSEIHMIDSIRVDRRVITSETPVSIQLHGFCDASEKAYGCCIYVRSTNKHRDTCVKLLSSKTRVAPLKRLSLPRLELCGALLLSRLLQHVVGSLGIDIERIYLWTDSSIVLAWLAAPPTRWKTFVGNRVSEIQETTAAALWNHVSTMENPADLASRGVSPADLQEHSLWWEGPAWLKEDVTSWPVSDTCNDSTSQEWPEENHKTLCHASRTIKDDLLCRFSKLSRLQRIMAYCLRFRNNCKTAKEGRVTGELSRNELQEALLRCVRIAQEATYATEIHQLETTKLVDKNSKLKSLHPIFDDRKLLRVGGRLRNADLSYEEKHQLILPPNHHLTRLIVESEHHRLSHAGCQLLLTSLRTQYWIPNGRNSIRRILHQCLTCQRLKAKPAQQLMGDLPRPRVEAVRAFFNCGVDYTGPFHVKTGSRRSKLKEKCYVALFVCLATRAVHLEVVSNMTTEAFMSALRRFVSRRGRCQNLYSDNGTNFVGASRQLRELQAAVSSHCEQTQVKNFMHEEGINWHFIPPASPHFGGIWEAGVKSFKYHLRRTMGTICPTFEELTTLTCQIEACLNSRPLTPLSCDPADPQVLTPGHFLIGAAITSIPQPDLGTANLSLLTRWERLQQGLQIFWRRWSSDYLHHLQQRARWTSPSQNVESGALVVVKEDNLPPLCWKLAIIERVHPGRDGMVRVATIRTPQGVFKRPVCKLCPVPCEVMNE